MKRLSLDPRLVARASPHFGYRFGTSVYHRRLKGFGLASSPSYDRHRSVGFQKLAESSLGKQTAEQRQDSQGRSGVTGASSGPADEDDLNRVQKLAGHWIRSRGEQYLILLQPLESPLETWGEAHDHITAFARSERLI